WSMAHRPPKNEGNGPSTTYPGELPLRNELLQVLGVAYRVAAVLVDRLRVGAGPVPGGRGTVGEGAQDVHRHAPDEVRGLAADAVRLVAVDGLDPAHRAAVEDAGAARVGVVGGVAVAALALAGQRRVGEHLDGARHRVGGIEPVVLAGGQVRE